MSNSDFVRTKTDIVISKSDIVFERALAANPNRVQYDCEKIVVTRRANLRFSKTSPLKIEIFYISKSDIYNKNVI